MFRLESLNGRQKRSSRSLCALTLTPAHKYSPRHDSSQSSTLTLTIYISDFALSLYNINESAYINIDRKCGSQKQYPIFGNNDNGDEKNSPEEWQMNE